MNTETNTERRRSSRREANRLKKLSKKNGTQGNAMEICCDQEEQKIDHLDIQPKTNEIEMTLDMSMSMEGSN